MRLHHPLVDSKGGDTDLRMIHTRAKAEHHPFLVKCDLMFIYYMEASFGHASMEIQLYSSTPD